MFRLELNLNTVYFINLLNILLHIGKNFNFQFGNSLLDDSKTWVSDSIIESWIWISICKFHLLNSLLPVFWNSNRRWKNVCCSKITIHLKLESPLSEFFVIKNSIIVDLRLNLWGSIINIEFLKNIKLGNAFLLRIIYSYTSEILVCIFRNNLNLLLRRILKVKHHELKYYHKMVNELIIRLDYFFVHFVVPLECFH